MLSQEKVSHLSHLIATMKQEILEFEKVTKTQDKDRVSKIKENLIELSDEIEKNVDEIKNA